MKPVGVDVLALELHGESIVGGIKLENGVSVIVLGPDKMVAVLGKMFLMNEDDCKAALRLADRRLREHAAEVATIYDVASTDASPSVVAQRMREARDIADLHKPNPAARRKKVASTLGEESPEFMPGTDFIGIGKDDVQIRADMERLEREIPEV